MNALRAALAVICSAVALFFVSAAPAQAADITPEMVNDSRVIGPQWRLLDSRTMAPAAPGAHMTITWGNALKGNDGCNDFWGHASVNGVSGTVDFHIEGMTRRACFVAGSLDTRKLDGTFNYFVYGDRLTLSNAEGTRFTFGR